MRKLRPFREDSMSASHGYDLPLLVSHLEGLAHGEECKGPGPKATRLHKVESAIELLNEALEIGGEA